MVWGRTGMAMGRKFTIGEYRISISWKWDGDGIEKNKISGGSKNW